MDTMLRKALGQYSRLRQQVDSMLLGNDGEEVERELKKFVAKRTCWIEKHPLSHLISNLESDPDMRAEIQRDKSWTEEARATYFQARCYTLLKEAMRRDGELIISAVKLTKLELVGTVIIPPTIGKFVAVEKFVRDTGPNAKVKICYLGDNFKVWFLNGVGKTEDPISETTLRYHKLQQSSVAGPIITELGGEAKAETTLSDMFSLMEKQGKGEDGVLLNNGYANTFYIEDIAGVLRAVGVEWDDGGWYVYAKSVECPRRWGRGRQVFSRNPPTGDQV